MRLVVSGYYGFGNAGDEAVLAAMVAAFRRREPGIELVVISGDPADTLRVHGVRAIGRRLGGTLRALLSSNGLVSGGGGLLQDRTSRRSLLYYAGVMLLARLLRRPVFVYAQGIGPVRGRIGRVAAGMALRRAAYVSVRDRASLDAARALGVRREIEVSADPAIATDITRASRGLIVVAMRPASDWIGFEPALADALRELARTQRVTFVAMASTHDRELAVRLVERVGDAELTEYADLDELGAIIGAADIVIGMRLHALVLAAAAGVRFIGLPYDPKVESFAAALGQPTVDVAIRGGELAALTRAQWDTDLTAYRRKASELASRAERPAEAILALLGARLSA
ncbi:polysaccharide pyruvyl transferase CsaB [soil metagenome]